MVSWINSNFSGWGSGITVPGYGFILHNRGGLFTLDPKSPNVIAPNKRPYNTLSAMLVMQNDRPLLVTGQHGGDQQGQGNMQVLVNMLDLRRERAGRGRHGALQSQPGEQRVATGIAAVRAGGPQLTEMGHKVVIVERFAGRRLRGDHVHARPGGGARLRAGRPFVLPADRRRVSRRVQFQRRRSGGGVLTPVAQGTGSFTHSSAPRSRLTHSPAGLRAEPTPHLFGEGHHGIDHGRSLRGQRTGNDGDDGED